MTQPYWWPLQAETKQYLAFLNCPKKYPNLENVHILITWNIARKNVLDKNVESCSFSLDNSSVLPSQLYTRK